MSNEAAPPPGLYGSTFVPANPNIGYPFGGTPIIVPPQAVAFRQPPMPPSIHMSPTSPMVHQQTIPSPVIPPQAALRAAIMAGAPLPTGFYQPGATPVVQPHQSLIPSPIGGGYMIPNPNPESPSRLVYEVPERGRPRVAADEGALVALDEPASVSATIPIAPSPPTAMIVPIAPPPPIEVPLDPIQQQIAKAIAAGQTGKI